MRWLASAVRRRRFGLIIGLIGMALTVILVTIVFRCNYHGELCGCFTPDPPLPGQQPAQLPTW